MRKAEVVMALAMLVGAGALLREATRLPIAWTGSGPGAGFFPFLLTVGVGFQALLVLVENLRAANDGAPRPSRPFIPSSAWKPLAIVFLPMLALVAFIDYLGIYLGGTLYLAGYMWQVGRQRWLTIVLVSVLVPLVLFFIFEKWFLLPMPKGTLLEYLLYKR